LPAKPSIPHIQPKLTDHDLKQMDVDWQRKQPEPVVRSVLTRALDDLRVARDRLNQGPNNSSRPPSSVPTWQRGGKDDEPERHAEEEGPGDDKETAAPQAGTAGPQPCETGAAGVGAAPTEGADSAAAGIPGETTACVKPEGEAAKPAKGGPPGRRHGAPGHGREQHLLPTQTQEHRPLICAACQCNLASDTPAQAWTGWDTLEMESLDNTAPGTAPSELGVRITCTRHLLMQQRCQVCDHVTQAQPVCVAADPQLWPGVELGQQRLLGPRLAAAIVYLCLRARLSRRQASEFLWAWLGLKVSAALIDQTVHQAARSVAPLEQPLADALEQAVLVHGDETGWLEAGQALWLWVLCCPHTVLYMIGARARDMLDNALSLSFGGWLMSDGYIVYRERVLRLRCWAHLLRKLRGLAESTDRQTAQAGAEMLAQFEALMEAVFVARKHPERPPPAVLLADQVARLRHLCEQHRGARHKALRELAREFLNDWDVIVQPLHDPRLPLTNNAAERQLRHYVIARRISYGTRSLMGSQSFALLASIFDTCRLRGACPIDLIAQAIHAARLGLPAPTLPPIPPALLTEQAALGCA
jgi:transposase